MLAASDGGFFYLSYSPRAWADADQSALQAVSVLHSAGGRS